MGYCSRSKAAALIQGKRVRVNGRVVCDPEAPVRIPQDRIEVDGSAVSRQSAIYLVMNKPRGIVTTASDEKGRETVYDVVDDVEKWLAPVGRLDKASEGLLLLTNDSEWAARITDPASHLDKVYHVQVDCVADADLLQRIRQGCVVDGDVLSARRVRLLRHGDKNSWLEFTLDEGKNRQIRRLLEALGVRVQRLVRVEIGPLELGSLKKGTVRKLTAEEKHAIDQALARRARSDSGHAGFVPSRSEEPRGRGQER